MENWIEETDGFTEAVDKEEETRAKNLVEATKLREAILEKINEIELQDDQGFFLSLVVRQGTDKFNSWVSRGRNGKNYFLDDVIQVSLVAQDAVKSQHIMGEECEDCEEEDCETCE